MAELFMECEEEELEPWQQKAKTIVVDDDDDDEPIFVGEILSSKPASTYILNRVNPSSSRMGMQNGASKRGAAKLASPGAVAVSPGFPSPARPAASTLAVQPQPRAGNVSGASQVLLQRPLSGCSSPHEAAKSSAEISPPLSRTAPPTQSLSRSLSIPVMAPSASRPVATVAAQPAALNRVVPNSTSGIVFGIRQNLGVSQCQSGSAANATGLSKRPCTSEANTVTPKKAKADESESPASPSAKSPSDMSSFQKDIAASNVKNGPPFPQACPKCNIHFNLLDPLKNHMKYCCPDMVQPFLGITNTDCSDTSAKVAEAERGKLIMLVNDFYYGKYEGNVQQVRQEQKTHTTFKCASCMKLLKNNVRFMNHMKHHLELEKQNSESWESHTTCQHCYRQFPTPFQLQCHIESTHTPYESSTICKICELSYETEQVLLQHMKDNHKPGEMPYVCQVCSFRSSVFSDVEKHFRAVHENTKNLLCPFCLKVIKIGAPYMHHYMRHQKKGVHRCNKCRLQFLTCKEKMDHKSQHHRTFRKPAQLEGLPPGTKVTIRASVGSLHPGSATASSVSTNTSTLQLSPNATMANPKNHARLNANKAKPKLKPLSMQKKQSLTSSGSSDSSNSSSGSSSGSNKRNLKIANTALNNLRCSDIQKCIECYSDIRTFASHFPAYVHCSLCRYSTSCSKAYVNHMMSFHSARQSKRFWIYKMHSEEPRGMTVVCLNCDFLTDASGLDKMATHLNESPAHTCQVIVENVSLDCLGAENLSDFVDKVLQNNENEEKSQKTPRPSTPEGQAEISASASPQIKDSAKEASEDHPRSQMDEGPLPAEGVEGESPSVLETFSSPGLHGCSKDLLESAGGGDADRLGNQTNEGPLATDSEDAPASTVEHPSISGLHTSSKGDTDHPGKQVEEDSLAAQCKDHKSPSVLESTSGSGLQATAKDPADSVEGADAESFGSQDGQGPLVVECKENTPVLENPSSPGSSSCSNEPVDSTKGVSGDHLENKAALAVEEEWRASASTVQSSSALGLGGCMKGSAEAATGGHLGPQVDECEASVSAPPAESSVRLEHQAPSVETVSEQTACGDDSGGGDQSKVTPGDETLACPHPEDAVLDDEQAELGDLRLADVNVDNSSLTSEEDVSFEQFLRRRGEPESSSSDASEQGSVHLEPLTPSEVLEHEATEILQKGGVAPSAKRAGPDSEQADVAPSGESSPAQAEAPGSQSEVREEAS